MEQAELSLIEKFANTHPIYTAKIFEFISIQDLLFILQNINRHVSAKILEKLSPSTSLELISQFTEEKQKVIVKLIKPHHLIAILRFLDKKELSKFVKNLGYIERAKIEGQLKYDLDEVGAWMSTNVPQINADYIIKDVKKYLDEHYNKIQFKEIYVTNHEGLLEGVINLDKMLLASDDIKAGSIAKSMKYILSPRVKLAAVQNYIGFKKYDRLPVVSKDKKILGVFSYLDLKNGLSHGAVSGLITEEELTEGYGIYGDTLLSLLNIK